LFWLSFALPHIVVAHDAWKLGPGRPCPMELQAVNVALTSTTTPGHETFQSVSPSADAKSDPISDVGYALMALGTVGILCTHTYLAWVAAPKSLRPATEKEGGAVSTARGASSLLQAPFAKIAAVNVLSSALLGVSNIMVYRAVLAEQLLGVVLDLDVGHGPVAVITTVIILLSILQLFVTNLVQIGVGAFPSHPRWFAACGLTSLFFISAIVIAKFGMGIFYYDTLPLCPHL